MALVEDLKSLEFITLTEETETNNFSTQQTSELDQRVDNYLQNPSEVAEWEDVNKRLVNRKS